MAKFRKKPVVIDAWQFDESASLLNRLVDMGMETASYSSHPFKSGYVCELEILTLEGEMKVSLGDWIIKGVEGEFYPCKPSIFEKTYEAVEE